MSQPRNPTDTQALLQSMLQRLRLQPGREGQAYLHTPEPLTAAPTWGQGGASGASNLQKVNPGPVNGFGFGTNGIPAADSDSSLKGGEIQPPGRGCGVDGGLVSCPTQKDNIDGDTGRNRSLGQPGTPATGAGQLFPAAALQDADITSVERTDEERVSFGTHTPGDKDAVTSMGQNQDQNQDQRFTPRVYMWSVKPTDVDTGSQEDKVSQMGNGGAFVQSKDTQVVPTDQNTTNSGTRRKQRPSEKKTRKWTQKIKEKWRDRSGSFGKKGKEDQKSERGPESSPGNQLLTAGSGVNTSDREEEGTLPPGGSSGPSETPLTHTEEASTRSTADFEFGLGSFSLLEEIVTGQEWAKFLNPNLSAASANQKPAEELRIPTDPHDSGQPSVTLNHQWSFRSTETSPDFSMAQISPDAFQPVSMDVSEGKQPQHGHREADQSEPMEHGHVQSGMRSGESGTGQQLRSPTSPTDLLNKSAFKSRGTLNRKRQHQPAESRDERLHTEKIRDAGEPNGEGSRSSLSHVMEEAGESQRNSVLPLSTFNSPPPLSPSSFNPFARPPRGVLKHSMSQDSESSMGTVTKRRRVEENRRVRFAEEVMTIAPPQLDLDATDSEEDSGADEDSVIEQECEGEQAGAEVAAARRPALPAWIRALKRRNTGRKHR